MKMSSIKRAIHNGMGILLFFLLVIFTTSCTGQEFQNSESMQNEQTTGSISTEETAVVSEELEAANDDIRILEMKLNYPDFPELEDE